MEKIKVDESAEDFLQDYRMNARRWRTDSHDLPILIPWQLLQF
jgi:hypothetical protein